MRRSLKLIQRTENPITTAILLFNDVEVLDFAGPFEVFSIARQVGQLRDAPRLFEVITIAEREGIVTATGGLRIQPHFTIENHPSLDLLIIPGGWGTRREKENHRLLDWIAKQEKRTKILASVCTGAFLLAEKGILDGKQATTHWNSLDWMRQNYPRIAMVKARYVVDEGHIITSAGVSAGIDMSLHLVARIHGRPVAEWTAKCMEYDWIH